MHKKLLKDNRCLSEFKIENQDDQEVKLSKIDKIDDKILKFVKI